jgi:protein involved in polysaccharide export with SLBB domain
MRLSPFLRFHSAATRLRVAVTLACCATLAVGAAAARPASAQSPMGGRAPSALHATRTQLESLATVAERQASAGKDRERQRKRDEAGRLRERLREGDFQAGDQIVLEVQGEPTLSDTFSVRSPRQLLLPGAAPIALDGVLRSELTEHLTKELSRYLKSPTVRATSLVRLQVTGQVARPGYYAMPSDVLVSDAIMIAGGPTASGDLKKITINRGDKEVMDQGETQDAIRGGLTLDQLNVRAGDEVLVGELKRRSVGTAVQVLAGIATIAFGVLAATR